MGVCFAKPRLPVFFFFLEVQGQKVSNQSCNLVKLKTSLNVFYFRWPSAHRSHPNKLSLFHSCTPGFRSTLNIFKVYPFRYHMGGDFHTDSPAEGPEKSQYSIYTACHPPGPIEHFKTNAMKCYSGFLKFQMFC